MLPYKRSDRVRKLIQQEICEILRDIKDPDIGFVTITDVELTDDLIEAKVYYSVIGDIKTRANTDHGLKRAIPYFRKMLGEKLELRRVPTLQFVFDETFERAERVFALMNKISDEDKNRTLPLKHGEDGNTEKEHGQG